MADLTAHARRLWPWQVASCVAARNTEEGGMAQTVIELDSVLKDEFSGFSGGKDAGKRRQFDALLFLLAELINLMAGAIDFATFSLDKKLSDVHVRCSLCHRCGFFREEFFSCPVGIVFCCRCKWPIGVTLFWTPSEKKSGICDITSISCARAPETAGRLRDET
jgi:hypothetical protein